MKQSVPDKQVSKTVRTKSSSRGKQAARDLLLLAAASNMSAENKEQISRILGGDIDWQYLLYLADFHEITPLIAHNILADGRSRRVPEPYAERLRKIYSTSLYKNMVLSDELIRVLSIFDQHKIPVISLKGTVLAEQLYGNPALRSVADIDILVQAEKLSPAGAILGELGYQQSALKKTKNHPFHQAPYYKRGQFPLVIELHWDLDNPEVVAIPQEKIWHRVQQVKIQDKIVLVLSPEDTLIYLANNFTKPSNLILKSLCDFTELLKKYNGNMDWNYILASARSWEMEIALYYSLKHAQALLGAPVDVSTIHALKPGLCRRWAIGFLLNQKVFISPVKSNRIRNETSILVRCLMMKHARQAWLILENYRGKGEKTAWLRTLFWIIIVFITALGISVAGVFSVRE